MREEIFEVDFAQMKPGIKLHIDKGDAFFGPGLIALLKEINRYGSVREASDATGISYGKTWKLLKKLETGLGITIVERQQGGKNGGSARVTAQGMELVEKYERLEAEVNKFAVEKYKEIFIQK